MSKPRRSQKSKARAFQRAFLQVFERISDTENLFPTRSDIIKIGQDVLYASKAIPAGSRARSEFYSYALDRINAYLDQEVSREEIGDRPYWDMRDVNKALKDGDYKKVVITNGKYKGVYTSSGAFISVIRKMEKQFEEKKSKKKGRKYIIVSFDTTEVTNRRLQMYAELTINFGG